MIGHDYPWTYTRTCPARRSSRAQKLGIQINCCHANTQVHPSSWQLSDITLSVHVACSNSGLSSLKPGSP